MVSSFVLLVIASAQAAPVPLLQFLPPPAEEPLPMPLKVAQAPDISKLPAYKANLPTLVICSMDRTPDGQPFVCTACVRLAKALDGPALKAALAGYNVRRAKNEFADFERWGVHSVPAIVLMDSAGKPRALYVGFSGDVNHLLAWLRESAAGLLFRFPAPQARLIPLPLKCST